MKRKNLLFCVLVLVTALVGSQSSAFGYSTVLTFGDSLSDTGNVGRLTDPGTPLWVELLADSLGANLENRAYAGATTGTDNPAAQVAGLGHTGLQWQVENFAPLLATFPGDTLVTLWAGANDFLQQRDVLEAVVNIDTALEDLYTAGGRDFILPNLPNIGATPALLLAGETASLGATAWTQFFNNALAAMLQNFSTLHSDTTIYFVDMFGAFDMFPVNSPGWAELFWNIDGFHPSAAGHQLIFETVLAEVAPVPEPSTAVLLLTGLIGVYSAKRRKPNLNKELKGEK